MLVHHFGSKEELVAAVMAEVTTKLQSSFRSLVDDLKDADHTEILPAFWSVVTSKPQLPYMRLLFEVQVLAIQNPAGYKRYLSDMSGGWLRLIEPALPPGNRRRAIATLSAAVIDGLLLEFLSTGDFRRTSEALKVFIAQLGGAGGKRSSRK